MKTIKEFIKEHKLITAIGAGVALVGGATAVYLGVSKSGRSSYETAHFKGVAKGVNRDLPIPDVFNGAVDTIWSDTNDTIMVIGNSTRENIGKFFEELYEKVDDLNDRESISVIVGFGKELTD